MTDDIRRILGLGSRYHNDYGLVLDTLGGWWERQGHPTDIELVQGECPYGGADELCAMAWSSFGLPVRGVPMEPRNCDADCYHKAFAAPGECPRRGPERNQRMVDLGGYVGAFAFPLPGSRGTVDCIRRIKAARIPLLVVNPRLVPVGGRYA
ncbi:hypothetical protein ACFRAQ_34495 [Nocardia sp. NPDC056611]|uniref:hypothetical protein n=1 Tax=Nocardia sp. NPDC056611 TaxID=3345877 RepID=UPI00367031D5